MLEALPAGTLLLADAGYVGYALLRGLRAAGSRRAGIRVGRNVHLLTKLGYAVKEYDGIVYLWPQNRRKEQPLVLRLVRVRTGRGTVTLLTSVLETGRLSDAQVAAWQASAVGDRGVVSVAEADDAASQDAQHAAASRRDGTGLGVDGAVAAGADGGRGAAEAVAWGMERGEGVMGGAGGDATAGAAAAGGRPAAASAPSRARPVRTPWPEGDATLAAQEERTAPRQPENPHRHRRRNPPRTGPTLMPRPELVYGVGWHPGTARWVGTPTAQNWAGSVPLRGKGPRAGLNTIHTAATGCRKSLPHPERVRPETGSGQAAGSEYDGDKRRVVRRCERFCCSGSCSGSAGSGVG